MSGKKKKKKRGPVRANKMTVDGITFKSGLEKYTYLQLKKHKLYEGYENEKFQVLDSFQFSIDSYEHQGNGKGDYVNRGQKKILGISYKPDFCSYDYIIECKGRPNASFPIRWKIFKKHLMKIGDKRTVYMPKNQKDVDETIRIILKLREDA